MTQVKDISLPQFFWFFVQAQVGAGLFTLPYVVFQEANTDGWISVLLAWTIFTVHDYRSLVYIRKLPASYILYIS
ncbi:GerAB/ArcD/ProY family transporter [Alkalicoccobacillus plakortidis]|uniref:Spore germination protein n=1 Tax=Alkalicoccobacillus plakortidis TaxID=444060 RepID=A0ABT0XNG4_9BACI|nr:GerAB/ArcD/ProY family transporter [Alkalicoccobacillus plakortidis]MCM2677421.1 spore germination protein [Alkalicoccobacillus plakortidis]